MVEDVGELGKGAAGAEADAHHLLLHHPTRGVGAGADAPGWVMEEEMMSVRLSASRALAQLAHVLNHID